MTDRSWESGLLTGLPFGIVVYHAPTDDPSDVTLVFANELASELTGADASAFIGASVRDLPGLAEPQRNGVSPADMLFAAAVRGEASQAEDDYGDENVARSWFRTYYVPLGNRFSAALFQSSRTRQYLDEISRLAVELGETTEGLDSLLARVTTSLAQMVGEEVWVVLPEGDGDYRVAAYSCGAIQSPAEQVPDSAVRSVLATGETAFVSGLGRGDAIPTIVVPLPGMPTAAGAIAVRRSTGYPFTSSDSAFVQAVADRVSSSVRTYLDVEGLAIQAQITDRMAEGVCLVRQEDKSVVWCNPAMAAMLEMTPADLVGTSVRDLISTADVEPNQLWGRVQHHLQLSTQWHGEVPLIASTGRLVWCESGISQWVHPLFGAVSVCVFSDITLRRHAENQLADFFELSKDLLALVNFDGNLERFSESSWYETLGWTAEDLAERTVADLVVKDDEERLGRFATRLLNGQPVNDLELRCITKSREIRWVQWSARVNWQDQLVHVVGRDVTDSKRATSRLESQARTDDLTGLVNRSEFMRALTRMLAQAERAGEQTAVLYLDLDEFKEINDNHGHSVGDEVLRRAGDRIRAACRDADISGRIGGDEFAIAVPMTDNDKQSVFQVARRVVTAFEVPIRIADTEFVIGVSVGVAFYPDDGHQPSDLLRHSDQAMYAAKRQGGARVVGYSEQPQDS